MNKQMERAHIESDEVGAVKVRRIGASAMSARKTRMDAFAAVAPVRYNHLPISYPIERKQI